MEADAVYADSYRAHAEADRTLDANINPLALDGSQVDQVEAKTEADEELNALAPPVAEIDYLEVKTEAGVERNFVNNAVAPAEAQMVHYEANIDAGGYRNILAPAPEVPAEPLGAKFEAALAANGGGPFGVQNMTSSRGGDVKTFEGYLYTFDKVLKVRAPWSVAKEAKGHSLRRVHFYSFVRGLLSLSRNVELYSS